MGFTYWKLKAVKEKKLHAQGNIACPWQSQPEFMAHLPGQYYSLASDFQISLLPSFLPFFLSSPLLLLSLLYFFFSSFLQAAELFVFKHNFIHL